ncbi:hypothetical protein BGZ46_005745, partial [Entomortierella lignicola]
MQIKKLHAILTLLSTTFVTAWPIGDHSETTLLSGNDAKQAFGNSKTDGDMSPQLHLVRRADKPCLGVPVKANLASLVGLVPITVLQDVPILSAQNQ